jgi:hypothetical protein
MPAGLVAAWLLSYSITVLLQLLTD